MIKQLNRLFLLEFTSTKYTNNWKLKHYFSEGQSSQSKQYQLQRKSQFKPQRSCRQKLVITSFNNFYKTIQYDTSQQQHYLNYTYINQQFHQLLNKWSDKLRQQQDNSSNKNDKEIEQFSKCIQIICRYPLFAINKQELRLFYNIIQHNIHKKEPLLLQRALTFMILADNSIQQTKLYQQFAKFYINSQLQVIKSRFGLSIENENVIGSIKKLLMSIYQRGFFSRIPQYTRVLYITNHVLILGKMIEKQRFYNSLLLKKVLYQYFIDIKQFYQKQMKQNLYHQKNIQLMQKIISIMKVLCVSYEKKIDIIESQCKQLRQLYVKLFLVINKPNLKNSIFMYKLIKDNKRKSKNAKQQLQIYEHIENSQQTIKQSTQQNNILHKQKQQQLNNSIEKDNNILTQFMQKFKKSINQYMQLKSKEDRISINIVSMSKQQRVGNRLTIEQKLLILTYYKDLQIDNNNNALQLRQYIEQQIVEQTSLLILHLHLQTYLNILKSQIHQALISIFTHQANYQLLTLQQVSVISMEKVCSQNYMIKLAMLQHISSVDITQVGTKQLLYLLNIYTNTLPNKSNQHQHKNQSTTMINEYRVPLINFILRFLADHHQSLPFDQHFQSILYRLFINSNNIESDNNIERNSQLLEYDFNDSNDNYPLTILQEMHSYLNKNLWKINNKSLKKIITQKLSQFQTNNIKTQQQQKQHVNSQK